MINVLTTAHHNGTLERKLKEYVRPQLLLLDELGYLPIDKRGADLMFQIVAPRYEAGSITDAAGCRQYILLTSQKLFYHFAMNIGQSKISALIAKGKPFVIEAQALQQRCM